MKELFKSKDEKQWCEKEVSKITLATNLVESMIRVNNEYPHSENDFDLENISNFWIDTCEDCGSENTENHRCLDCCSDEIGQSGRTIFEWWIVDDQLARLLEDQKESILRANGLNFWGRTCSGQAILLDGTLQAIYRGFENEK